MILSIWRYSHLTLAISSFVFILIASITGIILAIEPISEQLKPYGTDLENQSLASTISILQERYDEVISIEKDHNDFVIASVITKEGNDERFYINAATGEKIGDIIERPTIYKFSTNLHRSLFLKSTGRIIIGVVSFLLFLIATTGIILIVKRQGGVSKFFSKVIKEEIHQYYHVILGRWCFIPILIITLTGVYLSLEKFSLLPKENITHDLQITNDDYTKIDVKDFELFQNIPLADIKTVEFPFSEDVEDYFFLKLENKELIVHQYTGAVLSEQKYPFITLASSFSLQMHTGRGSILWSLILLISTTSILYFIYSGFSMTIQRIKRKTYVPKNIYRKNEAEYVILIGSETGNTYKPAKLLFDAIEKLGKKVFITELDQYTQFKKLQHLIVLTSTYGKGEAPVNARDFLSKITTTQHHHKIHYSVVGFGSHAYPDFCAFAIDIDDVFQKHSNFIATVPLAKIHNQSFTDFSIWVEQWSTFIGNPIKIAPLDKINLPTKQESFEVVKRSDLNADDTFTLQLRSLRKINFQSGDLLEYYPDEETIARSYSIGTLGKDILLSIKKHELGIASSYFSQLIPGDFIKATIQKNKSFHFPEKVKEVILIANGTGIAPFLGMINENTKRIRTHLFWGGRTTSSFELYKDYIEEATENKKLTSLYLAYSREKEKQYVQHLIEKNEDLIVKVLSQKGVIMICGSLEMESGVKEVLEFITKNKLNSELKKFQAQIKTDCY